MPRAPEKPLPLPPSVYYVLIGVNLLLRFTWSLKLSSHLHYLVEWERDLLLFEALELDRGWKQRQPIYRLWMWLVHVRLFGASYRSAVTRELDLLGF